MQLKYGSQNLVLEKNRIRFTDTKYLCIRNYDKNSVGGIKSIFKGNLAIVKYGRGEEGEEEEGRSTKLFYRKINAFFNFYRKILCIRNMN